jgi:hypothetical protein
MIDIPEGMTVEKVWKEKADEAGDKKFKTKGLRT